MSIVGRRFGVSDLMIVVAATAIGIAGMKPYLDARFGWGYGFRPEFQWVMGWITFRLPAISALLLSWSIGLIVIRLRPPGPGRRRLAVQPGFVASVTASLVAIGRAAFVLAGDSVVWATNLRADGSRPFFEYEFLRDLREPGFAVAAAWLLLAFGGRWRPEASAIDRLGRLVGVAWIVDSAVLAFAESVG